MNFADRVTRFQKNLTPTQLALLSTATDICYFSNYQTLVPEEREGFFVITSSKSYLIHASFSPTPTDHAYELLENCRPNSLAEHLKKLILEQHITEILYDATSLFVEEFQAIENVGVQNVSPVKLTPLNKNWIWQLRMKKDADEVLRLRRASEIISEVMARIAENFEVGITEKEIANQMDVLIRELGADQPAFPTIVAFGDHGALPHYQPSKVPLVENTAVLIDAGAWFENYRSDMTRTFWFGAQPDQEFLKIEKVVKEAYQQTLSKVRNRDTATKLQAKNLDEAARGIISTAGYGQQFIHTTGHGVGIDIHEPPSLNWKNETVLETGMIITIEPGIYLPDKFGYRYENTVLITEKSAEELTN
jgi:Xaa-Pro dipeptidase